MKVLIYFNKFNYSMLAVGVGHIPPTEAVPRRVVGRQAARVVK